MRITEKGQVTIPKAIRDKLGVGPGSEVMFVEREDSVVLERQNERALEPKSFDEWATSVAGLIDTMGMDGKEYIDWLRGPRDDLDPC